MDYAGEPVKALRLPSAISALNFAPDDDLLYVAGVSSLFLVDLKSSKIIAKKSDAHQRRIRGLANDPDNNSLWSVGDDMSINQWTPELKRIREIKGHGSKIFEIAFPKDREFFVTAGLDNSVRFWPNNLDKIYEKTCNWIRDFATSDPDRLIGYEIQCL